VTRDPGGEEMRVMKDMQDHLGKTGCPAEHPFDVTSPLRVGQGVQIWHVQGA